MNTAPQQRTIPRILFVSPCGPYPKTRVDRDPVDFFYYRNTLGQGIFRLRSFQSWYSLHRQLVSNHRVGQELAAKRSDLACAHTVTQVITAYDQPIGLFWINQAKNHTTLRLEFARAF